jgi:hypothetical protein
MNGVNNRNVRGFALPENRRRDGGKPVVNMHHIRAEPLQRSIEAVPHIARTRELPHRNLDLRPGSLYELVICVKPFNLDTASGKEAGLRVHNGIFPATLLIPVVNNQYSHLLP